MRLDVKLQLRDAIYRLRFYSNSLIHVLSLSGGGGGGGAGVVGAAPSPINPLKAALGLSVIYSVPGAQCRGP